MAPYLDMSWHPWYDTCINSKPMTSAFLTKDFSDYCAQRDAQNTIQLNVTKYCYMLCDALRQNYIDHTIRMHERALARLEGNTDTGVSYHKACLEDLKDNRCGNVDFIIESGRKYHKIIFIDGGNARSVHAFVDRKTGEVYKSASWKSPAKGVRFNLNVINEREWLFQHADWAGAYLYRR